MMIKAITALLGELVTIVGLVAIFAMVAVLTGSAIDFVWPPADGESAVVRINANRNGLPALIIAFVATMYVYRFALAHQHKSKFQSPTKSDTPDLPDRT